MEVKTRTNTQMGLPREYVTAGKQARIRKTALFYLCDNGLDCPARFDVAEVYAAAPGDEKSVRIVYLEDAFQRQILGKETRKTGEHSPVSDCEKGTIL